MGLSIFDEKNSFPALSIIDNAQGTTPYVVWGAGQQDRRIDAVVISNTDTVDHIVNLTLFDGINDIPFASINIPAGSGAAGVPPVEVFSTVGGWLANGIVFTAYMVHRANVEVAVASGKQIQIVTLGGVL